MQRVHFHSWLMTAALVALAACSGSLGDDVPGGSGLAPGAGDGMAGGPGFDPNNPGQPGDGPSGGGGDGDGSGPAGGDPNAPAVEGPASSTRVPRLTHAQWRNSVVDLLRIDDPTVVTVALRDDPRQGGFLFDNDGSSLVVDGALFEGYRAAADQLAEYVTGDPARLQKLSPDTFASLTARRDDFIERFGLRAHRRPLSAADRMLYEALFDAGPTLYQGLSPAQAGVRAVVEAVLQAPMFLYRAELSSQAEAGAIPLDGYEVASRLSYFLWNTMPDDTLLEAAADGTLDGRKGVESQVSRLLSDARATATVADFHAQLLEAERWSSIRPSDNVYSVSDQLGEHAIEEQRLFVGHVFEQGGSFATLLTSRETFVNDELARIYGLSGSYGSDFELATLPADERAGLFTQIGFLAGNATSVDPDPIHRGKFLAERITCKHIAAPPTMIPAPPAVSDKTNRERIADFTEMPGSACAGCHAALINPFGFPFENFDAIGTLRTTDRGKPVDTMASPLLDGMPTFVADGVELAERMADSEETHRCYVKHWLEYAHGRPEQPSDEAQLLRLTEQSLSEDAPLAKLLTELVLSDAFLTRSTEELP